MNNEIFCGIASSLNEEILQLNDSNLTIRKIESNEIVTPKQFSILVLNKKTHTLYSEKRYLSEKIFKVIAYYDTEIHLPQDILDVCNVFDRLLSFPGMLSHQQISILMKLGILLYDGKTNRVKGASYDLLIDREHLKSGIKVESSDTFKIDPLDYVVVGAVESVNIPPNICASFDTKVSMFCRGIILSNGPQVDPGYQGRLLCLLFNTSAKEFEISPVTDFEFSTIQFFTLSEPTDQPYCGKYLRKEYLRDYIGSFADESIAERFKSIPELKKSVTELKKSVTELKKERRTKKIIEIIFSFLLGAA